MSVNVSTRVLRSLDPLGRRRPARLRADREQARQLSRQDRITARLAELHSIRAVLRDATTVVSSGWLQHSWFAVTGQQGQQIRVSTQDVHVVTGRSVSGACLVGAIVSAGGGPSAVHTQLVQRTLDLTWHALYEDARQPVQWCPAPSIRTMHIRDLTRWNDHRERTADQVTQLLHSAVRTADFQTALLRT